MNRLIPGVLILLLAVSCHSKKKIVVAVPQADVTIAFGSCNKADEINPFWDDVLAANPDLWIWGGDNIYADTDNAEELRKMYQEQKAVPGYAAVAAQMPVIGTWDDHDYGLNDGGSEFVIKGKSQAAFLDFMGVPMDSPRRQQEGVYAAHDYRFEEGTVKIWVLDTRYFRTGLTPDPTGKKRFVPNTYGKGTLLGEAQWQWLEEELKQSQADFNIVVSSIQFLSNQHGFECWGNFPHEVARMEQLIAESKAKGVFILSGDRHISEFSETQIPKLPYSLVDFTSSGLTHSYDSYSGEPNPYRNGKVVSDKSYGLVQLYFDKKEVVFSMRGDGNVLLGELVRRY